MCCSTCLPLRDVAGLWLFSNILTEVVTLSPERDSWQALCTAQISEIEMRLQLGFGRDRTRRLCRDTGKVLLMRKVKHGGGKWGMPGGSQDSKDVDSLATAEREFRSEIGEPPQHEVNGQIAVKRCFRPHRCPLVDPTALAPKCRTESLLTELGRHAVSSQDAISQGVHSARRYL